MHRAYFLVLLLFIPVGLASGAGPTREFSGASEGCYAYTPTTGWTPVPPVCSESYNGTLTTNSCTATVCNLTAHIDMVGVSGPGYERLVQARFTFLNGSSTYGAEVCSAYPGAGAGPMSCSGTATFATDVPAGQCSYIPLTTLIVSRTSVGTLGYVSTYAGVPEHYMPVCNR